MVMMLPRMHEALMNGTIRLRLIVRGQGPAYCRSLDELGPGPDDGDDLHPLSLATARTKSRGMHHANTRASKLAFVTKRNHVVRRFKCPWYRTLFINLMRASCLPP